MNWKRLRKPMSHEAKKYLETEQLFQLQHGMGEGEKIVGEPKSMTGAAAAKLNRRFELAFMDSKDPKARLWRWTPLNTKKSETCTGRPFKFRSIDSINQDVIPFGVDDDLG